MSTAQIASERKEIVKEMLKAIHGGASPSELKAKFRDLLARVSPIEIVLIEQELVKEGVPISDILKLCDLHVELFRDFLASRELKGVPSGHPLDLLARENEWILKNAEALSVYARALANAQSGEDARRHLEAVKRALNELRKVRLHYRKLQMLIFPYLERRGIVAVPRVLWGREDQAMVKLREILSSLENPVEEARVELASKLLELAQELSELVFRENKILYPAVYALFSEGEWAAIAEIARDIGYIVDTGEGEWRPSAEPVYPYELEVSVTPEQLEKLPPEFKAAALQSGLTPDTYRVEREGDIKLETGFLTPEEIEGIFRSLPLEVTFADPNDRVRFYSRSELAEGFVRAKTILGRRIPFCHPPRLEKYVMLNVDLIKKGQYRFREFWTKQGDRVIRVIVAPVRAKDGRYLGTLEVVEDLTEVVNNPEEVKKKVVVL